MRRRLQAEDPLDQVPGRSDRCADCSLRDPIQDLYRSKTRVVLCHCRRYPGLDGQLHTTVSKDMRNGAFSTGLTALLYADRVAE